VVVAVETAFPQSLYQRDRQPPTIATQSHTKTTVASRATGPYHRDPSSAAPSLGFRRGAFNPTAPTEVTMIQQETYLNVADNAAPNASSASAFWATNRR